MSSETHATPAVAQPLALGARKSDSSFSVGQKLAAAGGIIGALAASSCCILPVVLFSLGIGGAWIGNFTQLAPYQPYFIAATLVFIGVGYWLVYRSSKVACAEGEACARPLPNKFVKIALVAATVIVLSAWAFDYVAPYVLS
ncbi:MAG: mercury transporter MerT [Pseudolabrys sp.]|nr:mercury transporter MerT [Pseudolabrys sp.]